MLSPKILALAPFLFLFLVFGLLALSALRNNSKMRKYEQRKRQKLLDQQNNTGRRIYNYLDREIGRLGNSQLKVEMGEVFENNDHLFRVLVVDSNIVVVEITINMFVGVMEEPIKVHRWTQIYSENWPANDSSVEVLCSNLVLYICNRYAWSKI